LHALLERRIRDNPGVRPEKLVSAHGLGKDGAPHVEGARACGVSRTGARLSRTWQNGGLVWFQSTRAPFEARDLAFIASCVIVRPIP
jgi:hypothetical protein